MEANRPHQGRVAGFDRQLASIGMASRAIDSKVDKNVFELPLVSHGAPHSGGRNAFESDGFTEGSMQEIATPLIRHLCRAGFGASG